MVEPPRRIEINEGVPSAKRSSMGSRATLETFIRDAQVGIQALMRSELHELKATIDNIQIDWRFDKKKVYNGLQKSKLF